MQRISTRLKIKSCWQLHVMLILPVAMLFIFEYIPIAGLSIAFQQFLPGRGFFGSKWVGLKHFRYLMMLPDTFRVIRNTVVISFGKIILTLVLAVIISLLLNELPFRRFSAVTQTVMLFPYYLSWVVLGGIIVDIFSFTGLFNDVMEKITGSRIPVLISNQYFRSILFGSHVWKETGYNIIILMAAIAGIDETMYEAGEIDGANRLQRIWYLTLPSLMPMIAMLLILAMGNIMSAGFDQIFVLYSTPVFETSDILDTYIFRVGIQNGQYSISAAVGLFKSFVGMVLVLGSYWAANKFAGYRVF